MTTTPFQREWIEIAKRIGLSIELSHEVDLGHKRIVVPVLLEGYGASRGMLLVTDYDLVRDVAAELVALGYGFSCLDAFSCEPEEWQAEEWGAIEEMLQNWGAASPSPSSA